MPFSAAHLRRHWTNFSVFKIIWRESSANVDDMTMADAGCGPLLRSLHWLPVKQLLTYKMTPTAHKVRATATPMYLSNLVHTHAPARALRSPIKAHSLEPTPIWHNVPSVPWLHPSGMPCLLNFDCATLLHSNETQRHTFTFN